MGAENSFLRADITLILFTIVILLPFIFPVAKYPIPTSISPHRIYGELYLLPTALVQKRWPFPHIKAIAAAQHQQ